MVLYRKCHQVLLGFSAAVFLGWYQDVLRHVNLAPFPATVCADRSRQVPGKLSKVESVHRMIKLVLALPEASHEQLKGG
jgi:hypothetical protein